MKKQIYIYSNGARYPVDDKFYLIPDVPPVEVEDYSHVDTDEWKDIKKNINRRNYLKKYDKQNYSHRHVQ